MKFKTLAFISSLLEWEAEKAAQNLKSAQNNFESDNPDSVEDLKKAEAKWSAVCDAKRDFDEQDFV